MAVFDHSDWFLVLLLKCWDTSHYPKTFRPCVGTLRTVPGPLCSSVGTLRTVPRPSVGTLRTVPRTLTQVLGHFALSHDLHSSFGTLHTVPRLPAQVLGHFVLSQDPLLKSWDTSYCHKTACSSVGTPRTVPRPLTQALGHFALPQDLFVLVLGQSDLFFFGVGTLRSLSPVLPLEL